MSDLREFRRRAVVFVKATRLSAENAAEVQEAAHRADVKIEYTAAGNVTGIQYTNRNETHVAPLGSMAVIYKGQLTCMSEIEFLRKHEPHGFIDWTEPRLQVETLHADADRILARLEPTLESGRSVELDYEGIVSLLINLLSDVRATGSEAEAIREGYGWSCRQSEERAFEAQQEVGEYKHAVRLIKRELRDFAVTHVSGTEVRDKLTKIARIVRHLRVGRE